MATTERIGADFYETRAAAALAYCTRLCPPERVEDVVERAFARVDGAAGDRDALLRSAVRRLAAEEAELPGPCDYCAIVPRLLAARAERDLYEAEEATLREHLERCEPCSALKDRFVAAEDAFDALLPVRPPPSGARAAVPNIGRSASLGGDEEPPAPLRRVAARLPRGVPPRPDLRRLGARLRVDRGPHADLRRLGAHLRPDVRAHPRVHRVAARLRPGVRARRHVSAVLFVLGVLLIAEAITTVVWKEPFTAYLASRAQAALRGQLAHLERAPGRLDTAQERSLAALAGRRRSERRLALLAHNLDLRTPAGRALGWIEIPRIGIDYVFVQSTDGASLRKGPAHYRRTALPGEPGTVGIAGHRTTYLAPFRDIDELKRGDRVTVRMPYGRFVYAVERQRIVPAGYRYAFARVGYDRLVLSACHPLYSASHRILVFARLVGVRPLGAPRVSTQSANVRARRTAQQLAALGSRDLQYGMTGPDVHELQRLLGVPPTGFFAYETQSAVLAFAQAHGLGASGVADEPFKRALARRPGPPTTPPTPPPVAPAGH